MAGVAAAVLHRPDGGALLRRGGVAAGAALVGILSASRSASAASIIHNSAVLFDTDTRVYRKRHLVPFGEYTPLPWLFEPVIGYFEVPMSVLSPWTGPQEPMPVAGRRAAVSICYEDAFPGDIRPFARDAEFLVNITEDAWFGDSLAPGSACRWPACAPSKPRARCCAPATPASPPPSITAAASPRCRPCSPSTS
ncbi:MAG: hypothetical protein M5U09_23525 [Gammaproteobacteria bacterium]|nr:hypothetical protein [Gammaproteobacteria bacterium]